MPGGEKEKDEGTHDIEEMRSEELRAILIEDLNSADADKLSFDEIKYIVGILKQREAEGITKGTGVVPSWGTHQNQNFDGVQEISNNKFVMGKSDENHLPTTDTGLVVPKGNKVIILRKRVLLRVLVAIICLLLSVGVVASALKIDVFSIFKSWTEDLFQVQYSGTPTLSEGTPSDAVDETALEACGTASEALSALGISQPLLPAQIPTEFSPTEFQVSIFPDRTTIYEYYEAANDSEFSITINIYTPRLSDISNWYQKDDGPVEVYLSGGAEHYMMSNFSINTAVWTVGNYECFISGNISVDILKAIIDSIYK